MQRLSQAGETAAAPTAEDQGKDKTMQGREVSTLSYGKLRTATLRKKIASSQL